MVYEKSSGNTSREMLNDKGDLWFCVYARARLWSVNFKRVIASWCSRKFPIKGGANGLSNSYGRVFFFFFSFFRFFFNSDGGERNGSGGGAFAAISAGGGRRRVIERRNHRFRLTVFRISVLDARFHCLCTRVENSSRVINWIVHAPRN